MPAPGCTQLCKRPLLLLIWLFQSSSAELSWNHFKMQILTSLRFFLSCFALDGVLGWNVWDRQGGVKSKSACSLLRQLWKICSSFGLRLTTWSANILVSSHKPQLHMCTRTCVCVSVSETSAVAARRDQLSRADGIVCGLVFLHTFLHLSPFPRPVTPLPTILTSCAGWSCVSALPSVCFHFNFTFIPLLHPFPFLRSQPLWFIYLFIFWFSCLKTWHVAASVFLPRATRMINER